MFKNFKIYKFITTIILCILAFRATTYADDLVNFDEGNINVNETVKTSAKQVNIPDINSRSAVVIDRNSNTILYGKNENDKRKMASTTKIMTCLLTLENCNLADTVEISKKSAGTGGSRLGLKTGDKITVKDLLYGLMLCSGNDAAVALAEHVSGSVENFAILMNDKVKKIGLNNTNFETPHGLDSENHYTTAYELALLANYALKDETFSKIVGTKTYTVTINGYSKQISNTNELLGNLNGVYGIKTGFTNGANRCLVTACKRDNLDIICVVLGADTKNFRTKDSIKLIEYSFKTFISVDVQRLLDEKFNNWKEKNLSNFKIIKGKNNNISYLPLQNKILPIEKILVDDINIFTNCQNILTAPKKSGTIIGNIIIFAGDKKIATTDIFLDCNLEKKNFKDYFIELFSKKWWHEINLF